VFRARRRLLCDEVALKIVRSDIGADLESRERFLREARACAQLRHPNIVAVLDYNLDAEGRPFLVMEMLNGRSLRQEIIDRGPLPLDEVQSIMGPLYGALQLAHDQGILHRDLKPANIVAHDFGGGTRAHKIVDFGLVRIQASDSTGLTGAHQVGVSSRGAADAAALRGRGDSEGARARARGSLPVREGRRRRPPYRLCVRNASMSASSSITFATGFPVP
jgi:serine/threonine protein kinase